MQIQYNQVCGGSGSEIGMSSLSTAVGCQVERPVATPDINQYV